MTRQIELDLNWSKDHQSTLKTNFFTGENRDALEQTAWKPAVSSSLKEIQTLVANIICTSEALTKPLVLPSCPISSANLP